MSDCSGHSDHYMPPAGRGGAGRGQGRKQGTRLTADPKRSVVSQRYSDTEMILIKSVAGEEVGAFIHDAAVDRARQFAEEGVGR